MWTRWPLHLPQRGSLILAERVEWSVEATALDHSGGTAPDLHRASLLCPPGHPRPIRFVSSRGPTVKVARHPCTRRLRADQAERRRSPRFAAIGTKALPLRRQRYVFSER